MSGTKSYRKVGYHCLAAFCQLYPGIKVLNFWEQKFETDEQKKTTIEIHDQNKSRGSGGGGEEEEVEEVLNYRYLKRVWGFQKNDLK